MANAIYDVIIVGARVAGSVLATKLGEAGHRVLLLDKARFPSDTLSTHFFRGGGLVGVLRDLDVLDEVLATGAPPLTHEYQSVEGSPLEQRPPQNPGDVGFCLSIRRSTLDAILAARAERTSGVTVSTGVKVSGLERDGDRVRGVTIQDGDGRRSIAARLVVGADGRRSVVAATVEPVMQEGAPPIRALYYRYVTGFPGPDGSPPEGPEFSFMGDELAYVFPSDAGVTCIALSIPASSFAAFRADARAGFDARLRAHQVLAVRFEAAVHEGFHGSHPEESWMRVPWGPGWALVGDAGLHLDPWTGLGMDFAGVHAGYLAEAIDDVLAGRRTEADAMASYHARRDEHALDGFRMTVTAGRDLRLVIEGASS